jgi:hypothetical protein
MDETEQYRRIRQAYLNEAKASREKLEVEYGIVYDTEQLGETFEVIGFMAPFVVVKHKITGKKGSLEFQHSPRFYFNWRED